MNKYIKMLAAVLCLGMGFTSCQDKFDDDDRATFPAEPLGLGVWVADQSATSGPYAKNFSYELNITLNAAGDTIYNVSTVALPDNALGVPANYPICTPNGQLVSYDPVSGMSTVQFPLTETSSMVGAGLCPAVGYFTLSRDWSMLSSDMYFVLGSNTYNFESYLGNGLMNVRRAQYPIHLSGYWAGEDESGDFAVFYLTYDLAPGISGQCVVDGGQDYCSYTYDKATGTGTVTAATTGAEYTLQYNEIGQLYLLRDGKEPMLLEREAY